MWSCPPVLCAGRDRARASGGRKKLKGATLTSSRVAPSDREGPGWVQGWRLELADHLVVVRSWLLHEPDLGLSLALPDVRGIGTERCPPGHGQADLPRAAGVSRR